jgi:alpha-tubulin suppressor-like RCC1 family protein
MTGKIYIGTRIRDVSNIWTTNGSNGTAYVTDTSAKVGINNTNPLSELHVTGDVSLNNLIMPSFASSANYNDWGKSSNVISTTLNVGINKTVPAVSLDISGRMTVTGNRSTTNATQTTGTATVADVSSISQLTHYGNMTFSTVTDSLTGSEVSTLLEISGNIIATNYVVINSDTSEPDYYLNGDMDVSGNAVIYGSIGDLDNPFIFKVRDIISNDNTAIGQFVESSFGYINKSGLLVANGSGSRLGNASFKRKTFYFQDSPNEEADKFYMNSLNTFVITKTGKVFGMGRNNRGNCGVYNYITEYVTELTRGFTIDSANNDISTLVFTKIIMSPADPHFAYALTNNGRLYSCGVNSFGQLGDGTVVSTQTKTNKGPSYVNVGGTNKYVVDARCSGTYWLNGATDTYSGTMCVLDNEGYVWCCGSNGSYQCGQGTTGTFLSPTSVKVNAVTDLSNIVSIYDYGFNNNNGFFALHSNGILYTWGSNNGTIKLNGGTVDISYANPINTIITGSNTPIMRVWCDRTTSTGTIFVQTTSGLVFGTGRGYALGVNRTVDLNGWRQITHFNTTTKRLIEIYSLQGGDDSQTTVFAISQNTVTNVYTLWATGDNTNGQLGLGDKTDRTVWCNVGLHSDIVRRITKISGFGFSACYTVILLNTGHILHAGKNTPFYNDSATASDLTRFTLLY